MGTTFCSIHVYSADPVVYRDYRFCSFSHGWQTYMPEDEGFLDPEQTQKFARKISEAVNAPVLWFYIVDTEWLCLKFYLRGKQLAGYSGEECTPNKNLYQIPQLIGYGDGHKHHLSKIFKCTDIDLQVELLEEFLGVCLLPFPELLDEDPQALSKVRGDTLFRKYAEQEKELTGKRSAIQVELVQELPGLLYEEDWNGEWFEKEECEYLPHFKKHYYLYFKAKWTGISGVPVCFRDGMIAFISCEEMKREGADKPYPHRYIGDNALYESENFPNRLIFSDSAPAPFAGKTMKLLRGWYGLGFDAKNRLVLYDDKSTLAITDDNMQIIAKRRLKGKIRDIDGDYILTVEEKGGIGGIIRVYRICDRM